MRNVLPSRDMACLDPVRGQPVLRDIWWERPGLAPRSVFVTEREAVRWFSSSPPFAHSRAQVVAVIPVVGKSDSMTVDEMIEFKEDIAYFAAQANGLEFFNFSGG